jgi:type IV pilus assembly protein PilE
MRKTGFTLLELLVTISIIGILLAVGSVSFSTAQKRGRDSRRQADMKAIQRGLEQCYSLDTAYPDSVNFGANLDCATATETVMSSVPDDPKPGEDYLYTPDTALSKTQYCLCAALENLGRGNADGKGDGGGGVCDWDTDETDNDYFCVSNQQ